MAINLADNANSLRDKSFYTSNNLNDVFLGGEPIKKILDDLFIKFE